MSDPETEEVAQYLSFFIAGEEYASPILRVKEIPQYETVTRIPTTPLWIRGVMNLRGSVVPVIDLALKFGLAETQVTKWTCAVIVETEIDGQRTVMGVMADAVSEVIDLRPEDIEPPPAFGTRVRVDYLTGMGKAGKKFVLLLDLDRVLSETELLSATAVAQSAAAEPGESEPQAAEGAPGPVPAPAPDAPAPGAT